ncbi:hypothetical protein R1T16_14720 [Flavobacterium sp. DG1-102-2]|uniref:hypothetical protein n=1 Tax=Flavobacterium sp. DG1-102-2 TaxID=3081663 RepID=UPI00294A5683|nr:hypothetical protein [Flavobacterium sp. DG1-102-2]MDV6169687.1 hypothetical protein [Flavobacterium sp. DG1-102-2]
MDFDSKTYNKAKFISLFIGFTRIEEIDSFFNRRFQKWLFQNSHIVNRYNVDQNNNFIFEFDAKGYIINAEFSRATRDGIPLDLKDFIQHELIMISHFDLRLLDLHQQKRIEYYRNYLAIITEQPPKSNELVESTELYPPHNPNLWNIMCYKLFMYLHSEYYTKSKRELTNIWFYLNENSGEKYTLNATKDQYREFILKEYSISITNFDKASIKWSRESNKLDEFRINFEKTRI